MEHARKILLNETQPISQPKVLTQPTLQQPVLQQPPLLPQSQLDADIARILQSNLSDDEKAKSYSVALRRYRLYDGPKPDPFSQLSNQMVPQSMIKTTRLLKVIKPYLNFNSDFELVHDGKTVPLSNVVELAEAAIQPGSSPIGWREFADVLKRANVPRQLIHNDSLWRYMTPKSRRTVKKRNWEAY